jgi:hypothetical protein
MAVIRGIEFQIMMLSVAHASPSELFVSIHPLPSLADVRRQAVR